MSTGLTINKALYGTGSQTVDVTGAVSKKVKDGVLNFTVSPSSFGIDDPAPGQLKKLDLVYTINDGKKNQLMKNDNDIVWIDAPPQRVASGLQIVKAEYGYAGNFTDVTTAVQNLISSNGSIDLKVGFKEVGLPDPNPNKQKVLAVEYTINGAPTVTTFKDGERFKISAPALTSSDGTTPSGHAVNLFGILTKNLAYFFGIYLHALSVFTAIEFGKNFISPMLFGGLAFFIPFFSFWLLPQIVFWVRLFKSDNIII